MGMNAMRYKRSVTNRIECPEGNRSWNVCRCWYIQCMNPFQNAEALLRCIYARRSTDGKVAYTVQNMRR